MILKSKEYSNSKKQLAKYKPLVKNLRKDSKLSLLNNLIIMVRRLLLLYMAMFIYEMAWLQIMVFLILNFIMLMFLVLVRPYKEKLNNNLNTFNSAISILVVYFIMQINGASYYIDQKILIGQLIGNTIYISWVCNGLIILSAAFLELRFKLRKRYYENLRKKAQVKQHLKKKGKNKKRRKQ